MKQTLLPKTAAGFGGLSLLSRRDAFHYDPRTNRMQVT